VTPSREDPVLQSTQTEPVVDGRGHRAWQEGLPIVGGLIGAGLLLARKVPRVAAISSLLGLACAAFFRDPDIVIDAKEEEVLAAATGRVMSVDQVDEPWWIQGRADRVAIFLSLFDVHVNRFPTAGRLIKVKKIPGGFGAAFSLSHSEDNCRDFLALEGVRSRIVVAQISGMLARRSVQWLRVGDRFREGERLGMIRFGSRTDVYLPAGKTRILVKPGEKVTAGRTRIARYLE
jgi:phosphatidylserine decarboxylase